MATFNSKNFDNNNNGTNYGIIPVRSNIVAVKQFPKQNMNQFQDMKMKTQERPHSKPHLPAGTFRSNIYDKTIALSQNDKTRKFHFQMIYRYWNDPNYGNCRYKTWRLYILSFPNCQEFSKCGSHRAHMFFDNDRNTFYVCWDQPITSFEDANAIAFVWSKNFLKNCMSDDNRRKAVSLPSGTFRSKKHSKSHDYSIREVNSFEKPLEQIAFSKEVKEQIRKTIGQHKAERGGMLGSTDAGKTIDVFVFDKDAETNGAAYSPNVTYLSNILEEWEDSEVTFMGFVHSHPAYVTSPSYGDREYAKRIMEEFAISRIAMPIVMTSVDYGKFEIFPYFMELTENKRVNVCQCTYNYVSGKNDNTILTSFEEINTSFSEDEIMKRFEQMNHVEKTATETLEDTALDRVSNAVDLEELAHSLVIGIGCGGAREFYIDLARTGVKNFLLIDGDTVSKSNLSSQNVYSDEIGKYKTDVIAAKIKSINSDINVKSFPDFLTDTYNDSWFESMIASFKDVKNILLCGFTDCFTAQARTVRLAMKYNLMYLSAQHYVKGLASEIIYWHKDFSKTSPRSYLSDRYEQYLENGYENTVTSKGSPIFNTVRLNGLCEKLAIGLLMSKSDKNKLYSDFLTKCPDKNLILIRQHSLGNILPEIEALFEMYSSNPLFDDNIWLSLQDLGVDEVPNKDDKDFLLDSNSDSVDSRKLR